MVRRITWKVSSDDETETLERLTAAAEVLWQKHATDLRILRESVTPLRPLFGQSWEKRNSNETTVSRDRRYRQTILPSL
jgi:hypothetical protein